MGVIRQKELLILPRKAKECYDPSLSCKARALQFTSHLKAFGRGFIHPQRGLLSGQAVSCVVAGI